MSCYFRKEAKLQSEEEIPDIIKYLWEKRFDRSFNPQLTEECTIEIVSFTKNYYAFFLLLNISLKV